jgi:LPXTG-site transpeptidase (sortase) family protein
MNPKFLNQKLILSVALVLLLVAGLYLLVSLLYPRVIIRRNYQGTPVVSAGTEATPETHQDSLKEIDRLLIIPSLDLTEQINSGGKEGLNRGIWHKFAKRSDPVKGGNFVLTGHRFNFGLTPEDTKRKSPLYNVDRLKINDLIQIKWDGYMYDYKIYRIEEVPRTAVEIENQTKKPVLTMYTCTFIGEEGPRIVIKAIPINTTKLQ